MADLFQRIEDRKEDWAVEVLVTFLEIYNEEIRDLLAEPGSNAPRGGLAIREDKTVKVAGLTELKPETAEQVKEIVLLGNTRRTQSPTLANATSSRSHAVLQVHVTQSPRTASISEQRTMATLSIIDLAGSERAAATTNMGQRMVEGANINKSLLALGNCINALCENGGAVRHVPYRNSKLTRLLKFSLGGNCKTVMIVCVAPTSAHFDDTHNTLIYAERASKIKTKVVTRNVLNVDRHVGRYVEAINRLNIEIAELKAKLAGKRDGETQVTNRKKAEALAEVERSKTDMQIKIDQTKPSILDGAACNGKLSVARIKLAAIRARVADIDASGSTANVTLPGDLQTEKALLQALAIPEEEALQSSSSLNKGLQRSSNAHAMFDATMRAVSERKSEKLDTVSAENIRLDASRHKAQLDAMKAEEERNAMKESVEDMSRVVVNLVGMLGRCTMLLGEASQALKSPKDDDLESTAHRIADTLSAVQAKNDETFHSLVGHATSEYAVAGNSSSLDTFTGYDMSFTRQRRVSSGSSKPVRRSVAPGSHSSPLRNHKSPRRSIRGTMQTTYRRSSDKDKKAPKPAKSVQWRDEAGQGKLDDKSDSSFAVTFPSSVPVSGLEYQPSTTTVPSKPRPMLQRSSSRTGSESEWEDENERTDDSFSLSASLPTSSRDKVYASLSLSSKRPRPSRLDPSFLKSKNRGPALGSLVEDDESSGSPERVASQPFADRMNHPNERRNTSPSRKVPATPRSAASARARRRSNVGPVRVEKVRRRSSLIPQRSPPHDGPRRMLGSPGRRARRFSLTKSGPASRLAAAANLSVSESAGDISFGRSKESGRPTWK